MKHIVRLSNERPAQADVWEELICETSTLLAGLVEAKGGTSPVVSWLADKCTPTAS